MPDVRLAIEPAYERRILAEVAEICAAIPHDQLALQWDVARDMLAYEGAVLTYFTPAQEGIAARLIRIGNAVPADVELGFHLCYGTFGGRHLIEPADMQSMVELANRVFAGIGRTVEWIHMPVPVERDDDAYYAPLAALRQRPETKIYLGLIHDSDGLPGTLRRVAAANRFIVDYGVATECGWGRRDPATVPALIALHEEVVNAVGAAR